ncbi:MAG: hypothetical protein LIO40_06290 [Ruminococcus sp.]|nr:hypothetical protein [Ruminococcus sp.]
MANKNLKYFMRDTQDEIVTVPGPETFRDEEGNVLDLEIRVMSQTEIQKINRNYRKRSIATDKKGNPLAYGGEVLWKTEKDSDKATRHLIVEALQFPDLKDKELMAFYNCVDVTEMPLLVFSRADEYAHVTRAVLTALGMIDAEPDSEVVEEAKN